MSNFGPVEVVGACPKCGGSDAIVVRFGKYHHNACGFEWPVKAEQSPGGQRRAVVFDDRTAGAVNANLEKNPFCEEVGGDSIWVRQGW